MPRLRPIPWLMALQAALTANEHWTEQLSASERTRLRRLLVKSKGLPRNLTDKDRAELKRLIRKLDLPAAGRKIVPFAMGARKRRR
jgi:ParB-like chromosome segregation protein Spo0J